MNKQIHEWINTALIVAVLILVLVVSKQSDRPLGATGTRFPSGVAVGGTTSPPTLGGLLINSTSTQGNTAGGFATVANAVTCPAGTTTLALLGNTFGASSTIIAKLNIVTGSSTALRIQMGTTTASGAIPTSGLSGPVLSSEVATSAIGVLISDGSGDLAATGILRKIVVGPSEKFGIFASSSALNNIVGGGGDGANLVNFCQYSYEWQR